MPILARAVETLRHIFGSLFSDGPEISGAKDDAENLGKKLVEMLNKGEYAEIRSMLSRRIRWLVSENKLKQSWISVLSSQGKVVSVGDGQVSTSGDLTTVRFLLAFEKIAVNMTAKISATGYLTSIRAVPDYSSVPWSPPSYVDQAAFFQEELTLGADDKTVGATLTIPRSNPKASVVMLAGSGPCDRNSSVGQMKPFKDLAWGLANEGFAVIRFDKITLTQPGTQISTVVDEYLYHGEAAIAALREREITKERPIFILGHSFGGTVAPRLAKDSFVAGLVIMAGLAKPLHWTAIRQLEHLNSLGDEKYHVPKATLDEVTQQAKLVDGSQLSSSTDAAKLPFGVPAPYWLDLRSYNMVHTAAELGIPMLFLQGGRDYQVTLDDLEIWKKGLQGQEKVTFKLYPEKNHVFRTGEGPLSPEEFEIPGSHVDPDVVGDIAMWLLHEIEPEHMDVQVSTERNKQG